MASTAGIAPATSTFARWRSDLTELRGQLALGHLASVIGLAPIRPGLKGRLLELLCIHGQHLADGVGIAPTQPGAHSVFRTGALLLCQPSELVSAAGLAPAI